ncbi:MAG: M20/M25/M40 family metallo-hydrolase [Bacteroidota bacterium]
MKKLLLFILGLLLLFAAYLLINTLTFTSNQLSVAAVEKALIPPNAVQHFVEAISIRTVSFESENDFDSTQFRLFNDFLASNYPLTDSLLDHQTFNEFSHLYRWEGSDPELDPMILVSHIDVVPIASLRKWTVHPFTEGVKNDTIYGRGTMDDKFGVVGIMEAVEQLLKEGYQPKRTIYLAFGHDEEVSGRRGAQTIVNYLHQKGIKASLVLDEGQAIVERMIPGLSQQVALIGIAEKGYATLELRVDLVGGHSSMPAPETAIDVLAAAVSKVKQNPMPAKFTPALEGFIDELGPEMNFQTKLFFANKNLFKSPILAAYEKGSSAGNATIRTTTSPTIFEAGIKDNVIPTMARAVINFRIIPGETVDDIITHLTDVIGDDRVKINVEGTPNAASPVSSIDSEGYRVVNTSIKQIFPDLLTAPSLVIAATDARYYHKISSNVYRFIPYEINPENLACFHGIDERVLVSEFEDGIRFYRQMVLNGGN